ncbi:CBS domain-containing protein [Exilibacterium tricleocarpae]|uniref:CBS domain-containing protein n=1 Tax=Exilibacterium tricleocarpae TaxID=2591008 RepID=A0A545U8B3_9GAMM|nr:CBS domain-containing protein [Exilibacterium tricleocarpae]TQV85712.1 CBS domain-containing protein [Exilibacterium tricleocarpae]
MQALEVGGDAKTVDLAGITAQDVMSTQVMPVYEDWSIKRLADFFVDNQIAGAPVVTGGDQLTGVVTITDIMKFESASADDDTIAVTRDHYDSIARDTLDAQELRKLSAGASTICTVDSIMTRDVIHIDATTPLFNACATMLKNDVHRLFVTRQEKVIGVITSMDLLKPMARLASV